MIIDIDNVLETLKSGKTPKTQRSLDKLNETLRTYFNSGARDFSVTTIGRISKEEGGVGYESIRATANTHFRELIEAWAAKASTTLKKPPRAGANRSTGKDYGLLERIPDVALRAVFGQIIRERDRFKSEAHMLKNQAQIVIDKRPIRYSEKSPGTNVEIIPSVQSLLSPLEIKALEYACSDECLEKNQWDVSQLGQVKDASGDEIFPRGFMTALKKLLGGISSQMG